MNDSREGRTMHRRAMRGFARLAVVLTTGGSAWVGSAADDPGAKHEKHPKSVKQRIVPEKPAKTTLTEGDDASVIIVKFREGSRVRHRGGKLVADVGGLSPGEEKRLARAGL